jgi:hypothetical protein
MVGIFQSQSANCNFNHEAQEIGFDGLPKFSLFDYKTGRNEEIV